MFKFILFFLHSFIFIEPLHAAEKQCLLDAESDEKRVTVKITEILQENKRVYFLKLLNKMQLEISFFVIGYGKKNDFIQIFEPNIPKLIESPENWKGGHVFPEEGLYMHLYWRALVNDAYIGNGEEIGGYKIELELPSDKFYNMDLVYSGGGKARVFDYKKSSFTVYFSNGECYWGVVNE